MRGSTVFGGVALGVLASACVVTAVPAEEDQERVEPLNEPQPAATLKPTGAPRPPVDPSCGGWGCGANHNRRIVRLVAERT